MKKILFCLCAAALCLSLSACGGKKAAPFDPERDAKTLQDASGVFGEALTEIDQATACALYGIDEELAIFTFSDETAAQTAGELLGYRVEDRKDELKTYLPDELPKLDKAVVQVRSNSALLVIAADYGPVDAFLDG